MIYLVIIILINFTLSQTKKPVIIKGFDENTYIVNPDTEKWIKVDSLDSNAFNKYPTRIEYTNFNGETINLSNKKPIYKSNDSDIISNINIVNDPSKKHYVLYFQLKESSKVMLQIYTTDGVRISDLAFDNFNKGINKVNINKNYTTGSYVVYLTIGENVFKHRVLFD